MKIEIHLTAAELLALDDALARHADTGEQCIADHPGDPQTQSMISDVKVFRRARAALSPAITALQRSN